MNLPELRGKRESSRSAPGRPISARRQL